MIFFEECKNSLKPNFKIHNHLFYANNLGEPGGYKSSEKLNIDSAWENSTNSTKSVDGGLLPLRMRIPVKKILKKSTT